MKCAAVILGCARARHRSRGWTRSEFAVILCSSNNECVARAIRLLHDPAHGWRFRGNRCRGCRTPVRSLRPPSCALERSFVGRRARPLSRRQGPDGSVGGCHRLLAKNFAAVFVIRRTTEVEHCRMKMGKRFKSVPAVLNRRGRRSFLGFGAVLAGGLASLPATGRELARRAARTGSGRRRRRPPASSFRAPRRGPAQAARLCRTSWESLRPRPCISSATTRACRRSIRQAIR